MRARERERERERCICIFGFKGASASKIIGSRNEMIMDDYDGQMIFGDLVGLKLPDIRVTGEEKPRKNLTQETCSDRARCVTSAHATTCSTAVEKRERERGREGRREREICFSIGISLTVD